jgi:hypothetical protein
MWHHPKYYKELRKRNRDLSELQRVKPERSVPQSDQAISDSTATAKDSVRPGPGLKRQAASAKLQASSRKLQAPRFLNQETNNTQHVSKTLDQGPRPR